MSVFFRQPNGVLATNGLGDQRATDGQKTATGVIPEHDPDEYIS